MKYSILFLLLIAAFSGEGQGSHPIIHTSGLFESPHADQYPLFDGKYVWWNDTTMTYVSHYDKDSIRTLYKRVDFLMRDDLETHRRLDSLIGEMRRTKQILDNHGW